MDTICLNYDGNTTYDCINLFPFFVIKSQQGFPFNGMLGLGLKSNLIGSLAEAGLIPEPLSSWSLADKQYNSSVTFGTVDESEYIGNLTENEVVESLNKDWIISYEGMAFGDPKGKKVKGSSYALVTSSNNLIELTKNEWNAFAEKAVAAGAECFGETFCATLTK
jgi:hypothetical protein